MEEIKNIIIIIINGVGVMLYDVWTNPVKDATRGSREGGRGQDPSPLENHKFYRFI